MKRAIAAAVAAAILGAGGAAQAAVPQDPTPSIYTQCFYGPNDGYRVYLTITEPAEVRVSRADGTVRDYGVLYAGTSSYWFDTTQASPATSLDVRWTDSAGYVWDDQFGISRYAACHYYPRLISMGGGR